MLQIRTEYKEQLPDWKLFSESYIGGRDWAHEGNLFRHAREDEQDFKKRLERCTFINYCRPLIDIYVGFIYGSQLDIDRSLLNSPGVEEFLVNVNFCNETMNDFMEQCAIDAMIFGYSGILIDSPKNDETIISVADAQSAQMRSYLQKICPTQVCSWAFDRFGRLEWIRIKENPEDNPNPFEQVKPKAEISRIWTKQDWFLVDKNGKILEQSTHGLGVVPFVTVPFSKHLKYRMLGLSFLIDIARINRLLVNFVSYIDEFCSKQAFPFLAVPQDPAAPIAEGQVISANNAFPYPQTSNPPSYVSPATDPATFMHTFIKDFFVREIYRLAKLEHRILNEQSGVAKEMDFHQTNALLTNFGRNLEMAETQILQIRALWDDVSFSGSVDYPDDFNVASLEADLDSALKVEEIYAGHSATFISEHLKRLAKRIEPKLQQSTQAVINNELSDSAIVQTQLNAFDDELRSVA